MDELYQLSDDDIRIVRELITDKKNTRRNSPNKNGDSKDDVPPAPETYLIRVPEGGIPALDRGDDVGTGSSATAFADDTMSFVQTPVYRLDQNTGKLSAIGLVLPYVYNFSSAEVKGNQWALVTRDKWGRWFVITASGNERAYIVRLLSFGTGIDGGIAWDSMVVKLVNGVETDDEALYKKVATGSTSHNVLYRTHADDGSFGKPEAGDYVIAEPDPYLAGRWLFIPKRDGDTGGGSGTCNDCCWFADMAEKTCLTAEQVGGNGRCGCIPTTGKIPMVKTPLGGGGWLALKMGTTCCGCGGLSFQITDAANCKAQVTLYRYHVSCGTGSGGSQDVFTKTLIMSCCGLDKDTGQPFATFVGWGDEPCDGDVVGCDNVFRIKIACGPCPDPYCDCPRCGLCCKGSTPYAWVVDSSSFTDKKKNGFWLLEYSGACLYAAECYGITSELEPFEQDNGDIIWRLTHGGSVYEKNAGLSGLGWDCCGTNTLLKISGDGPDTLDVIPLLIDNECVECVRVLPSSVCLTIIDLQLTGAGTTSGFNVGDAFTLPLICDGCVGGDPYSFGYNLFDGPSGFSVSFGCINPAGIYMYGSGIQGVDSGNNYFCTGHGCSGANHGTNILSKCFPIEYIGDGTTVCIVSTGCDSPPNTTIPLGATLYAMIHVVEGPCPETMGARLATLEHREPLTLSVSGAEESILNGSFELIPDGIDGWRFESPDDQTTSKVMLGLVRRIGKVWVFAIRGIEQPINRVFGISGPLNFISDSPYELRATLKDGTEISVLE